MEADEPKAEPERRRGPGEGLKSARLARGMSMQQVQVSLRLDERTLAAIESDDYSGFSAPIFVKGYLRNYARLVGLNEAQVLADFESTGLDEPPPLVPLAARGNVMHRTIPWRVIFTMVPILLIIGAGMWVYKKSPAPGSDVPLAPPMSQVASESPDVGSDTPKDEGITEGLAGHMPESVTRLPDGQLVAETELGSATMNDAGLTEAAPDTTVNKLPKPAAAPPADADTGLLQLTVSDESWVEVNDANGRRLIYGLLKPGQVRRVSGRLPYEVLLGNSSGVSVDFNGESFDFDRFVRRNVARFEVGRR